MKKTLLLFALLLTTLSGWAHDFEVDGIYYKITSTAYMTAGVSYQGSSYSSYSNEYTGKVMIPAMVSYNGKDYSVTSIENSAFRDCEELTMVTIPESVTSIGNYAFNGCTGLSSITIPGGVTSMGYVFNNCSSLTGVIINSNAIASKAYTEASNLSSIFGNQVEAYVFGDDVTSIGAYACYGCESLKSVVISKGVTAIGDNTFSGCSLLTNVTINSNTIGSKSRLSSIFGSQVEAYVFGDEVTSIGNYACYLCENLTSVTIGNSVTSIGECAFFDCIGLTSITIPESVTSIGWRAFYLCTGLTEVDFASIESLCNMRFDKQSNPLSYAHRLYIRGEEVTEFVLPKDIVSISQVYYYNGVSYFNCHALNGYEGRIRVEEGNPVYDSRENCNAIIETATNTLIAGSALTTIIPKSVTRIGISAFSGCRMKNLMLKSANPPAIDADLEEGESPVFSIQSLFHMKLYIPIGSWDAYAYDNSWYKFHNICETAMECSNVAPENAYTLMNAKDFTYAVYDPVNDCVGMVSSVGVNEDNPNHCWQTVEVSGKKFLYNIGAKKFAVPATDGSSFTLSETVGSVEMTDGMDGIVLNGHTETQWALVLNESMSTDNTVENVVVTAIEEINANGNANNSPIYDLNGRQNTKPTKGINIMNGKKILVK